MRFLQLEWHAHERARNSWDIERAEMKAKIAKQEGEVRQGKRLNEQLERQVKMLEHALKNERAKARKAKDGDRADSPAAKEEKKEQKNGKRPGIDKDGGKKNDKHRRAQPARWCVREKRDTDDACTAANVPHNSFLDTEEDPGSLYKQEKEREQYLDNTSKYLKNCMKEIQYLLTPPQNPPPPQQMLPNGNTSGLPEPPWSVEDIYARQQQRGQRQQGQVLPQPGGMPNHQPPPVPDSLPQTSGQQANNLDARRMQYRDFADVNQQSSGEPLQRNIPAPYEEPAESIQHTFDRNGQALPDQQPLPTMEQRRQQQDADGWNFDDTSSEGESLPQVIQQLPEGGPHDVPPTRRPDTDLFPSAATNNNLPAKSPPRTGLGSHRRKSSGSQAMSRRRSSQGKPDISHGPDTGSSEDPSQFKVKFALRGHLDVVRGVIFSGGGSPSEPEVCTASDDGTIKRWIVPASYQNFSAQNNNPDLDIQPNFTHRGHEGVVTSLACCPASTGFSTGGRANGEGWIFSGGQDATVRVWERGRVDPKATLEGHTDAVWAVCVLPSTTGSVFGNQSQQFGGPDRLLLVSGSADGTIKVWAVSAPPQQSREQNTGSRRGVGGSRRHSVTSGSNFPSSPQPSVASNTPFDYTLVHSIERAPSSNHDSQRKASPTSICPLSQNGETFVVAYTDSSILIFDTRTGEEVIGMASNETYDGTLNTSINSVVATGQGLEGGQSNEGGIRGAVDEEVGAGATGSREGVEGVVISGHEDRFVRFFDANSGMSSISSLAMILVTIHC